MKLIKPILLLFLFEFFTSCIFLNQQKKIPVVNDGIIDLREWNFVSDGSVKLKGKWEFYWQKFLITDGFYNKKNIIKPDEYIKVPSKWNTYKKFPSIGYASYRIRLLLPPNCKRLSIEMNQVSSAFSLYLVKPDGQIVNLAQEGVPGKDKQSSITGNSISSFKSFEAFNDIHLIFEVSNFHYGAGGLIRFPWIGDEKRFMEEKESKKTTAFFIIGAIIFAGLYNLSLFFLHPKEKAPMWLSFFCFIVAMLTYIRGGWFIISFNLLVKIWHLCIFLPVPIFLAFISNAFSSFFNDKIKTTVYIIGCGSSLFVILTPPIIFSKMTDYYFLFTLITIFWLFSIMIKPIFWHKNITGLMSISGFFFILIAAINDILYNQNILQTGYIMHFGLLLFILAQSFVVAKQNAIARKEAEIFGQEVKMQAEELKKLDKLKDEFLANTSHELRTPLNGIIGIARSLIDGISGKMTKETIENLSLIISSGKRLANLVDDILDFSKLKNKDIVLYKSPVDIKELAEI